MKRSLLLATIMIGFVFISTAQKTYNYGFNPELGGYVFLLTKDKMHGVVAETRDQGSWNWKLAMEKDVVNLACLHCENGAKFTDWKLPNKDQLNEMMKQSGSIGNFTMEFYWSSTGSETNKASAYGKDPSMPFQGETQKLNMGHVRAVREF